MSDDLVELSTYMGKFRQQLVLANMYVFFGEATGVL